MNHINGQRIGVLMLNAAFVCEVIAKLNPPLICSVLVFGALTFALVGVKLITGSPN
jgi:hypothetical protein